MIKFFISLLFIAPLFAQTINLDTTLQQAQQTKKIPLIFLHRDGCGYCERMEEFTLDDDAIKNFIQKHFLFVSINISKDKEIVFHKKHLTGVAYANEVGYNFYPSVLFLDEDGDVFEVSVGYKEEEEFLLLLEYIHSPEYDTLSFEEFKQTQNGHK